MNFSDEKRQSHQPFQVGRAMHFPVALKSSDNSSTEQLLRELQLQQIELVMQNEELQRVKLELELERARYFTLYELAPVGYCNMSDTGVILQANLSAAKLLGVDRHTMIKRPLSAYMQREGGDIFYLLSKQLVATGEAKSCDVPMVKSDGTQIFVNLAGSTVKNPDGKTVMLIVLSDITERRQVVANVPENLQHVAESGTAADDELDGLNLLVIEDDDLGRKALTVLLETWGCSVTATTGSEMACAQIQLGQIPDAIISDYRLRDGRNGIQIIRLLREMAGLEIAACLISGDADAHVRQLAQDEGLVLLQKPVRPAKLRSLLRHLNQERCKRTQMQVCAAPHQI